MIIFELILTPSTLDTQSQDVALVAADDEDTVLRAVDKFCAIKGLSLDEEVTPFVRGEQLGGYILSKDWGMFGGVRKYNLTVRQANVIW